MFDGMSDRDYVEFLATLWERHGWETGIQESDPGEFLVTGDRETGERGLMLAVPDPDATIGGDRVQRIVETTNEKNVEIGVVATRGTVTDEAAQVADRNDIFLVDSSDLEETVATVGAESLVEEFNDDGGTSILDRLPVPDGVPAILRSPNPLPIPARSLTILLVVVGVIAVGYVGIHHVGAGIDPGALLSQLGMGIGGGSSGGMTITAASFTEDAGSANEQLNVSWTAEQRSAVTTENGNQYDPPPNETFVVVQMNVTNPGTDPVVFRPASLGFATNGTQQGVHLLQGARGQPPIEIPANRTESVWVTFTVPEGTNAGTIVGRPGDSLPALRFERDASLTIQVEE